MSNNVHLQIEAELSKGEIAQANGNEGMARVCARRAAGYAVREYLSNRHVPLPSMKGYDLLKFLRDTPGVSKDLQVVLGHLTVHVNEEHNLPDGVDLIRETRWLVQSLDQS